jgi:hypothetical protein
MRARWIFVLTLLGIMIGLCVGLQAEEFNQRLFAADVMTGTTIGFGFGLFIYMLGNS